MTKLSRSRRSFFAYAFLGTLLLTLTVYSLRVLQVLTFLPGFVLLILIAATLVSGLLYGFTKTRRF